MSVSVTMPQLGESVTEGTVTRSPSFFSQLVTVPSVTLSPS